MLQNNQNGMPLQEHAVKPTSQQMTFLGTPSNQKLSNPHLITGNFTNGNEANNGSFQHPHGMPNQQYQSQNAK